jgi:hypothetical protein
MMSGFHRSAQPMRKRQMLRALFLILTIGLTLSLCAQAQTYYYVAKTGSDSNSGSASAPWLTIGHAASVVQAGGYVYVGAGTYNESVTFANSGTSSAPIVFDGQGAAIVDGTGVSCCVSPAFAQSNGFIGTNTQGLFNIGAAAGVNYLTIKGFTIQNLKVTTSAKVPLGILVVGSGTGINILNNTVKNIQETAGKRGNAYGIGVFGISATPLSLTVSGNTVTGCLTGQSETTTYNGNVQNFVVSNNTIYNNDNIAMDAIGFEGVGPTGYDQATNGDVYGNLIYNNSAYKNPGEGNSYDQDGLYCDGCTQVTFERNTLYGNDLNIEAASEISGKVSSNVIIRNNLSYAANSCGVSVGGYAKSGTGGSSNIIIVNNSFYDNDTQKTGSGEFQVQYRATGTIFENNIVYAGAQGLFIHNFTTTSSVTADYNDYYTTSSTKNFIWNNTTYTSFASYQSGSGQDKHSVFANPAYITVPTCTSTQYSSPPTPITTCTPTPNFDIPTSSPAANTGNTGLGTPGSGYSSYQQSQPFVGSVDFNGNPRVNSSGQINIGAFEQ